MRAECKAERYVGRARNSSHENRLENRFNVSQNEIRLQARFCTRGCTKNRVACVIARMTGARTLGQFIVGVGNGQRQQENIFPRWCTGAQSAASLLWCTALHRIAFLARIIRIPLSVQEGGYDRRNDISIPVESRRDEWRWRRREKKARANRARDAFAFKRSKVNSTTRALFCSIAEGYRRAKFQFRCSEERSSGLSGRARGITWRIKLFNSNKRWLRSTRELASLLHKGDSLSLSLGLAVLSRALLLV